MLGLKEMLNTLLKHGWEPRGDKHIMSINVYEHDLAICLNKTNDSKIRKSYRELVSIDSGLRQFAASKGIVRYNGLLGTIRVEKYAIQIDTDLEIRRCSGYDDGYEYWLIVCSFIPEYKLKETLLSIHREKLYFDIS